MIKKNLSPNHSILDILERLDKKGFINSYGGNVSVKTASNKVVITPKKASLNSLLDDDFVVFTLGGTKVMGEAEPSRNLDLHLGIYNSFENICGVIYAHPPTCSAFACVNKHIMVCCEDMKEYISEVPIVRLEDIKNCNMDEMKKFVSNKVFMIENNGLVAFGETLTDAYNLLCLAEESAKIYLNMLRLKTFSK